MPLDPSIFMQYAQLQGRNNENLANTIGNVAQNYTAYKNKKTEGLDLEKLAQGYAVKTEMGAPTSPEEQAAFNVYQKFEAAKQGMDPYTGQTYSKFKPFGIDGTISEAGATGGGFDLGNVAPAIPASFAGGTNKIPGKPEDVANIDSIPRLDVSMLQGTGDVDMDAYRQTMAAQNASMANNGAPSGFDTDLVAPTQDLQLDAGLEGQSPRKAAEAKIDFQKDVQVKKAEAALAKQTDKDKKRTTDLEVLPILYTMIDQNAGTPDIPYAGMAQPATRVLDPKKSENVDLLKQNQLNLAAPLAKALGVNPTDKDFQATLQRIFDINATKGSRDAQIKQLINQIESKQGVESKLPATPQKIEGKRVRQKSTGKTGQIINGEFVPD